MLSIGTDGRVDLQGFRQQVDNIPSNRTNWWDERSWEKAFGNYGQAHIVEFMARAGLCKGFEQFFKQVLWWMGAKVQAECMGLIRGSTSNPICKVVTHSILEALTNAPLLDRMLVQYTESCKDKCRELDIRNYSCATDKASVGGLGSGLQATIIGLGATGYAIQAAPQVVGPLSKSSPEPP